MEFLSSTMLQRLRAVAAAVEPFGRQVLFYLAAAVSDFYVPWPLLVGGGSVCVCVCVCACLCTRTCVKTPLGFNRSCNMRYVCLYLTTMFPGPCWWAV